MSQSEQAPSSQTAESSPWSSSASLSQLSQFTGDVSQNTQTTEPASQSLSQDIDPEENPDLWGYLAPRTLVVPRLDFYRHKNTYSIGRSNLRCDCVLAGQKISQQHCTIHWEHFENGSSLVTLKDTSTNGTFVDERRLRTGYTEVLRDGQEVAFGSPRQQFQNGGTEDYRYIFKLLARPPRQGVLLGEYELCHDLGRGHFGRVRYAVHQNTGERFAIKTIQHNTIYAPEGAANWEIFRREVDIWRKLYHPRICEFVEAVFETDAVHIVMEYVPGGNLERYLARAGQLGERETQRLTYQICDALTYVHSMNVAHRDLKPENILLTASEPPEIKIADFGLAKAITSASNLNTMCGTPGYTAPEVEMQRHLERSYNCIIDSWSLGVVVFNMLTGHMPFRQRNEPSAYASNPPAATSQFEIDWELLAEHGVSDDGMHFLSKMLEPNPEYRMSTANALRHPWLAAEAAEHPPSTFGHNDTASAARTSSQETIIPGPGPSQ
ncbi:hypothetical protein CERSUDRAFT_117894 [Gelatoporia subvermispora B]|uniref:Kinase-like protein n=1 Tax=Ceriporiopsis subvermispora (strain B) TaxID=914234 RepID=M2R4I5_CERS8|nr:hypothetical protein CERSUDRAFT_117894 [Gelatoporia subvermispora B]